MPRIIGIVPLTHTTSRVLRPTPHFLVHYTGGGSPYAGNTDAQHMARLQASAINAGKTWEYNYVVTFFQGWIWEMAGEFQGAHCLNFNPQSYGVQVNLGVGYEPSQIVMDSVRWLFAELKKNGQLTQDAVMKCHYTFRSTACPGNTLADPPGPRWNSPTGEGSLGNPRKELLVPYNTLPPPAPPDPEIPHEDDEGHGSSL